MRAIVQNGYGSPDVLRVAEVGRPSVGDNDVLVRAKAWGVNAGDGFQMLGSPWLVRLYIGFRPKDYIMGWDVSGIVEEVGGSVKRYRPGDEVFGAVEHGFAEYVVADADKFAPKPSNLTFKQAAALPTAALTALQGLRDKRRVEDGHKVLVNGASGGVGHFAVQIGKSLGADVTGVCSTRNMDMVLSLGADHVVDYTKEDFTKKDEEYDLILDNVGNRKLRHLWRALKSDGIVVPNSGHGGMSYVMKAGLMSKMKRKQGGLLMTKVNHKDLVTLKELIESDNLRPVIDRTYTFERTPEAIAYVAGAHASGKVVISIEQDE
jgi:NADPH:quinone reductase-like Zn-dependent oxidoreductase